MSGFQKDQVQDIYYLSPMQEGMLFHSLAHRGQNFYVEQMSTEIRGMFHTKWLEESVNAIVERYDIFRTVFVYEKVKRPVQVVLKNRQFKVDEVDLGGFSVDQQTQCIDEFKRREKKWGFDLSKDIPMRMTVFRRAEDVYEWVWTYHHILFDGWCLGIVMQEMFQIYDALLQNKPHTLPPTKQYKVYIKWLESQDKTKSLRYWSNYLSGFTGQTTFAEHRKRSRTEEYLPAEINFKLTDEDTNAFAVLAKEQGVTLFTALQAAWGVLVSRYQGENDVVLGKVISGRPTDLSGVENMVGLFINVVPTRVRLSHDMSFKTLISQMQQQAAQSEVHQYVPIYDIQADVAQQNLIDHIVVFENYPRLEVGDGRTGQELGISFGELNIFEQTNYDLNFIASPGGELNMKIAYNSNVFEEAFVSRLSKELTKIIREVARDAESPLTHVEMLSEADRHRQLAEFNARYTDDFHPLTLTQYFEQQAADSPQKFALTTKSETWTYQTLNERANQIASVLQSMGVKRETVVAMIVDRSPEMIVGILAILKAGGAYLPIAPSYPVERIRYMLEDSGTSLLLTQSSLVKSTEVIDFDGTTLCIDDPAIDHASRENLAEASSPKDLAYLIYTSGTTGKPKGTLTTHENIVRVVKDTTYLQITPNDTVLSLSNYAFDGFTFDLFGALTNGARLVLPKEETILHVGDTVQLIQSEHVNIMFVTTALFNLLVDSSNEWMGGIRKVLFGGERASVDHVRRALKYLGTGKIVHVYGPTETTVFATFFPVDELPNDVTSIPIGRPVNDTSAYILGESNELQPFGAVGELCLGGSGLARGYLNHPDLTASKFVTHPFVEGQRMYRTGDLARWLPDGNIDFVGRMDYQVKIRGHRIELGEIEHMLSLHNSVKESLVQAVKSETGDITLHAYVVTQSFETPDSDVLRSHLATMLPRYMIPSTFVCLDSFPLTTNGKIDLHRLPQYPVATTESRDGTLPRNDIEFRLADIWSDILGMNQIGVYDDFFAAGGHSLKVMAVCSEIQKVFDVDVPLGVFFDSPTIDAIGGYIEHTLSEKHPQKYDTAVECEASRTDESRIVTLFNREASRNIFALPPVLGYGIVFSEIAKELPDYRIYAFDFIETEDRITRYAEFINEVQPEGPLALLGYSAGCSLAFEISKALEAFGRTVEVLIMVDSYKKDGISDLNGRTIDEDVDVLQKANEGNVYLENESIRQGLEQRMRSYYTFYVQLINSGKVRAPIHLIRSESNMSLPPELSSWNTATTGDYEEYPGYGLHDEMFQSAFVKRNAKLIVDVLAKSTYASSEM